MQQLRTQRAVSVHCSDYAVIRHQTYLLFNRSITHSRSASCIFNSITRIALAHECREVSARGQSALCAHVEAKAKCWVETNSLGVTVAKWLSWLHTILETSSIKCTSYNGRRPTQLQYTLSQCLSSINNCFVIKCQCISHVWKFYFLTTDVTY